ncbi:alanine dehydrogenase [Acetobacterium malicum]|uniref:alanine dehydrogenase n=1 Tax=Acetobacterium malicum TaxID=52692 RepID=UPI0035934D74
MIVGIPKEIKNNESRVSVTPAGVHALVASGHKVLVETKAGLESGIADSEYVAEGAVILQQAKEVFEQSDIIVKVKEPIESEYELMKEGQTLFTYLHLAPNLPLTDILMKKKITGIAYETVQLPDHSLPLLIPMSEVAGRMSVQVGATMLQRYHGGVGMLLGGVTGVLPAEVMIIGAGTVGMNAAKMAVGLGAHVTVIDISKPRLTYVDDVFNGRVSTLISNPYNMAQLTRKSDLLISGVLVAGEKAPKLVTEEMVKNMKKGSVIVDVAIDQGGSVETIDHSTTHDDPCFEKHGVIHYSVANMPGAVPRTSTYALTGSTLPYLLDIVNKGPEAAMKEDPALLLGLNTYKGHVTCKGVAEGLNKEYVPAEELL